jgi:chromosome segregation ATPase
LERLWRSLETVEQHRATSGGSRFGRLARERRRLKQAIRRSEKVLAPDNKKLDALRGQLLVLRAENEQLQRTLADQRSKEDDLKRRCADERAALDAILVAAKDSTPAADGVVTKTDPIPG